MTRRSFFASLLAFIGFRLATRQQTATLYVQDELGRWHRIATVRPEFKVRVQEWTPPHILR